MVHSTGLAILITQFQLLRNDSIIFYVEMDDCCEYV